MSRIPPWAHNLFEQLVTAESPLRIRHAMLIDFGATMSRRGFRAAHSS